MKRLLIIVTLLAAVAVGTLWWTGNLGRLVGEPAPVATLYDTDADGSVDLVEWTLPERGALWRWDRDADGDPEVVAYDAVAADSGSRRSGSITAWDWGGDGVIDEGDVPTAFQEALREPEVAAAIDDPDPSSGPEAAGPRLALVGPEVNVLVQRMRQGYDDWRLSGFRMPIVGATLPDQDNLLPGAPRRYRNGTHQGFDMYPGHVGAPTGHGGPVVAAKAGTVVRADHDYVELTPEEHAVLLARSRQAGTTPPDILDQLRGRQVWIDHGHGIVTRYCHLSAVAEGIREGQPADAGEIVGLVGNSGMEAGIRGSQADAHLHFELRIDDSYFGEGMTPEQIRRRAREVFEGLPEAEPVATEADATSAAGRP